MPRVIAGTVTWIPLLAATMNPEETPLFRYELTEETHKAKGQSVRAVREVGHGRIQQLHLFSF